jgi:hypothetical protein
VQDRERTGHGVFLQGDHWDDYGYKTLFTMYYADGDGLQEIGPVKIGRAEMSPPHRVDLPVHFKQLDNRYFSIGQDESYYEEPARFGHRPATVDLDGFAGPGLGRTTVRAGPARAHCAEVAAAQRLGVHRAESIPPHRPRRQKPRVLRVPVPVAAAHGREHDT